MRERNNEDLDSLSYSEHRGDKAVRVEVIREACSKHKRSEQQVIHKAYLLDKRNKYQNNYTNKYRFFPSKRANNYQIELDDRISHENVKVQECLDRRRRRSNNDRRQRRRRNIQGLSPNLTSFKFE